MLKPFTLKIKETEQALINLINNSDLPAFCIKTIFNSILSEIERIDEAEIEKYQQELKNEENKQKDIDEKKEEK